MAFIRDVAGKTDLNDEFDPAKGLPQIAAIYNAAGYNYVLGDLTVQYLDLKGNDLDKWEKGLLDYADIAEEIKGLVVKALNNHHDPIQIKWSWKAETGPKFIQITYHPQSGKHAPYYEAVISGHKKLLVSRLADRRERANRKK